MTVVSTQLKRIILILFLLGLTSSVVEAANSLTEATKEGKNYWARDTVAYSKLGSCDKSFSNIDSLYWAIKPDSFDGGIIDSSRAEIEENIAVDLTKLLTENTGTSDSKTSIAVVQTSDDASKILATHPKALYLKIEFQGSCEDSLTGGHSCSTYMYFLATKPGEKEINIGNADLIAKQGAKVPVEGDNGSFSYNLQKFLIAISCSILKNNSHKECTVPLDPEKNEIVPQKTPCQTEKE